MEENKSIKSKVISGLFWKYLEQGGIQFVQLVVSIILARLLDPAVYGITGLITVFIAVSQNVLNFGFTTALIRKKDATQTDYCTAFYCNFVISCILYMILFFAAPFIAEFYNEPILINVLRIQALALIVGVFASIQSASLQRKLEFKEQFIRGVIASLISAAVGIIMAYLGYGIWALVYSNVVNTLASAIILWFTVKWRPTFNFSGKSAKSMFNFGYKILITSIIDTIYSNMYTLVLGKSYDKNTVGYYNKGKQWPHIITNNLNGSIQGVMFPVLSKYQDDKVTLKNMVRRSITISSFIVFPAMAGLAAVAKPLTVILLTEKWLPSVMFLQFCCITFGLLPIHSTNIQAINAMGRSDITLKIDFIKKALGISVLIITIPMGILSMMIGRIIVSVLSLFINAIPNKKLLDYDLGEQIKDIFPYFALSLFMFFAVWGITLAGLNYYLTLLIQVVLGVVIYVVGAKLFKFEAFDYVLDILKNFFKRK